MKVSSKTYLFVTLLLVVSLTLTAKNYLPYKTGYLQVSNLHSIYYQLGGNPNKQAVMVLHGGPGGSCRPTMFKYFNLEKFHVILHDQRGSGKSKPKNELKDNNTWTLVNDIEKLRKHLKLGKIILFGGSWGSTLALAYAETYPENVKGIILRGVFTATQSEIDHFYHGGTANHFPEVYERLQKVIDKPDIHNYPTQLYNKLINGTDEEKEKIAYEWARYEAKLVFLYMPDKQLDILMKSWGGFYTFALMENYYMSNKCFLKEGQLLKNAYKLKNIPVKIVHGRYDAICLAKAAYRLHKLLPNSTIYFAPKAGHSSHEDTIVEGLKNAIKSFEK